MIDPFDTYTKYIAIKLTYDLSSNYDYFRYDGKTKQKKETFLKRKDKYHFYALAKRLNHDMNDVEMYLFVNLLYKPDYWIGDLLSDEAYNRFMILAKYRNALLYQTKEELKRLKEYMDSQSVSFNEMLSAKHSVPKLMEWSYAEIFSPMILHMFNRMFSIYSKWERTPSVFEPLLLEPMKRFTIFENYANRLSFHLTLEDISDIMKEIFVKGGV